MGKILKTVLALFVVAMALVSCDGNVFVRPDVSEDVDTTMIAVRNHLGQDIDYTLDLDIKLSDVVFNLIQPKKEENKLLSDPEMTELLEYLIPDTITINVDLTKIPMIQKHTMDVLLMLDKPQDIKEVNRLLSYKLENIARESVGDLYGVLERFIEKGATDVNSGLIEFGNVLNVPRDYTTLTYGDYIAVQMVLSLILKTIPEAFVNSYVNFVPESDETKMVEYIDSLGENIVKALIADDSVILHVIGTYTFLNKYNPSTTILDMRNLGSFFRMDEGA